MVGDIQKTSINLRPAFAQDAAILTAIHAQSFAHYWDVSAFNDFFAIAGTQAYIAYSEPGGDQLGMAVGIIVTRVQYEQADIMTIAVLEGWRKCGIGRMLVEKVLQDLRAQGVKELFLDVEVGNTAALNLYKAYDFKQINRRKHYYRQKDGSYTDALVMGTKLP